MTSTSTPRSVVVTGANKGIGYEAVKQLSPKLPNATIYLTARTQANGDAAVQKMKQEVSSHDFSNVRVLLLEIVDPESVKRAVASVKEQSGTLDVLLHNSGISGIDGDYGHPEVFNVNVRGARATIEAFTTILTKGTGKVIVVSSEVGAWQTAALPKELQSKLLDAPNTSWDRVDAWIEDWLRLKQGKDGVKEAWNPVDQLVNSGYSVSKALLNAYLRHFALNDSAPKLAIVCPGYCATDLNNNSGYRSAAEGGESVIWPIFNEFEHGKFYQDGKQKPFDYAIPADFLNNLKPPQ
ncbi:Short-chain dehydrogenase [Pseudozyma hubeiensis]|nr:Short-chain dehydrogenase [Pseudozyma hubeiensis]